MQSGFSGIVVNAAVVHPIARSPHAAIAADVRLKARMPVWKKMLIPLPSDAGARHV